MGHEITKNDKLVLHGKAAWHGLGLRLDDALTPTQASKLVFPWTVIQRTAWFKGIDGNTQVAEGFKINIRSDNGEQLGCVSDNYQVIQPDEVAEFCEALSIDGGVKVETAGSIRGGKKMWFLLKGASFNVALNDEVIPYVLVSSGYDGLSSFRVTPTTVRVVCSNTWHAVLPRNDTGELLSSAISIRHTCNIKDRIEEARIALAGYSKAITGTRKVADVLAAKEVTDAIKKDFFYELYESQFGEIPEVPENGAELRRREKAKSAYLSFTKRFDDEAKIAGNTYWNMANAFSGSIQHDQKAYGSDDVNRVERRVESNLMGLNANRTSAAFQKAFKLAVAN